MNEKDLIDKLNQYPMWTQVDELAEPQRRELFETVSGLSKLFQFGGPELRRSIAADLNRRAKYMLYQYSRQMATEARRSGSKDQILAGLIPVVMAGGRSDRLTGGSLLAILLRSGEATGQSVSDLFAYAADLAADEESRAQIRAFPSQPPEVRGIQRFGFSEIKTRTGVAYQNYGERMDRVRWWDRIIRRRRKSHQEALALMRAIEAQHPEWADLKE